jgi:hypothetical protein
LPNNSVKAVTKLIESLNFHLTISKSRKSILGNYKPPQKLNYHRISVNSDLHEIEFLIVLLHEIAHLINWNKHKQKVKPHGNEWKQEFRTLINSHILCGEFDTEIKDAIYYCYFQQSLISSSQCKNLHRILHKNENEHIDQLEDLPNGTNFMLKRNNKKFLKIKKLRKLYLCKEHESGKLYRVYSDAQIVKI